MTAWRERLDWGLVSRYVILATFMLLQRRFVESIAASGVKG